MFKIITVLVVFAITGCSEGHHNPVPLTSIWYGDSRCVDNEYIESRDCVAERKLLHLESIDTSYDIIIIHLGLNDMWVTNAETYGAHLSALIAGNEHKVWCIIPTWFNYFQSSEKVAAFREQVINRCPNTVDPNIDPYHNDQVHYLDANYRQILDIYQSIRDLESNR